MNTLEDLVQAHIGCRINKRNSHSALAFEQHQAHNLVTLHHELQTGTYTPGRSICFVITRPKPREVWAALYRDRIVHHLMYNHIAPAFHARFIADSCACIPGRGTLYAAQRLESKVRSLTQNWQQPGHYLKLDLANFFVSIDKHILTDLLTPHIRDPWWRKLTLQILWHDPRSDYELRGNPLNLARVPTHKRLTNQPAHCGLPIGNLSSQFFANVLLNAMDQYIKHTLRVRHYIRYVDDFVLLDKSPQRLNEAHHALREWLPATLKLQLNDSKTILQPIERGIDFVGQIIKPHHRRTRPRTVTTALKRTAEAAPEDLLSVANSYFGLLGQATASHHDRAKLANVVRARGHSVNRELTQTYRRAA